MVIVGAAAAGWALLSVLGEERQRLLREMEAKRPKVPPHRPALPAEQPVVAKPQATRAGGAKVGGTRGGTAKSDKRDAKSDRSELKSSARR